MVINVYPLVAEPRKRKLIDWNWFDDEIYDKIVKWFDGIKPRLCRPDILQENVYNIDETGILLFMLGSIKVFIGRNDRYSAGYSNLSDVDHSSSCIHVCIITHHWGRTARNNG